MAREINGSAIWRHVDGQRHHDRVWVAPVSQNEQTAEGMMTPDLEAVIAPEYVSGLEQLDITEVRARRTRCQQVENATSYVRRLAQGRLDIIGAELARRNSGEDAGELSDLIEKLPGILADGPSSATSSIGPAASARPPLELEPDRTVVDSLTAQLDRICPMADLGAILELGAEALASLCDQVGSFEQDVSLQRRRLHDAIAALQSEITRRYMSGDENVESLLS
jgi:hypothetical protein